MKTIFKNFFTNYQLKDKKQVISGCAILVIFNILDYLTGYSSTSIAMYCLGTYLITSGLIKKKSDYYQISKNYYLKNPLSLLAGIILLIAIPLYLLFVNQNLLLWGRLFEVAILSFSVFASFLGAFLFKKQ
ncbi:hypothetical protein [Holzapfeliella sp. JNUCC 72]